MKENNINEEFNKKTCLNDINLIDEDRLNELDQEVSHYLDQFCFGEVANDLNLQDLNNMDNFNNIDYFTLENDRRRIKELEVLNYNISQENEKLTQKIEEYLQLNREWETKVHNIKEVISELEEKNNSLSEENERIKDENEQIQFKSKLAEEKEKINRANSNNIKELQFEYENKTNELKKEYKTKEENLRRKYERFEEILNKKLKDQEDDFNEIIDKLSEQVKMSHGQNDKSEKEMEGLKKKLHESERFFQTKEQEFEDIALDKDRKLKELELCIKSISEEANGQINKLCESVTEFNEKINYYKQREMQITQEFINLKNQTENNNSKSLDSNDNTYIKKRNNNFAHSMINSPIDMPGITPDQKTFEFLRSKIKQLEEENLSLSRELNLKYEETETLNEELRLSYETLKCQDNNAFIALREKEDHIADLANKINELEIIINKYGQNLNHLKKMYDKTLNDNQKELDKKNHDSRQMQDIYEKKIRELQIKIENILTKENVVIQRSYDSNHNNYPIQKSDFKFEKQEFNNKWKDFTYIPKEIPDDEDVRQNINDQINYIREKLEKNFLN